MMEYKPMFYVQIEKLNKQLEVQKQINKELLEVVRMIEPYYVERYHKIIDLINQED